MNVFVLDEEVRAAAQAHCDRHVVKMILETTQLLHGAVRARGDEGLAAYERSEEGLTVVAMDDGLVGLAAPVTEDQLYKLTHANHPCARWARAAAANYRWLHQLGLELCAEYTHRYGRTHACQAKLALVELSPEPKNRRPDGFVFAGPAEYVREDVVASYRAYYKLGKAHILKYTKRSPPAFLS